MLLALFESKLHKLPLVVVGRRDDVPLVIVDSVELNLPGIRNAEAINKRINQEIKNGSTYLAVSIEVSTILCWQIRRSFFLGGSLAVSTPKCFIVSLSDSKSKPMVRCLWLSLSTCLTGLAARLSLVIDSS